MFVRPNILGDLRAEADSHMLRRAFLETADYRTLIETSDRVVVVGRRGTGKSALAASLKTYWRGARNTSVILLAPEEYQVIGIRPLVQLFGAKFSHMRAGSRLLWRYALAMEILAILATHYSFSKSNDHEFLMGCIQRWAHFGPHAFERFRQLAKNVLDPGAAPEERIGSLPIRLDLSRVEAGLEEACRTVSVGTVLIADSLDEGYEADEIGVGLIDGLVQAVIDLKTHIQSVRPVVLLRDNIFRAVEKLDPDYSRNIEGHVLRLHWDEMALLDFAAKRLKVAFDLPDESSIRIWNSCTDDTLSGQPGFAKALHKTLYRPRDLLALLNEALYTAGKLGSRRLTVEHLESTARTISEHRLSDLKKEYGAILPGLERYIGAFQGRSPELELNVLASLIENLLSRGSTDSKIQQDFFILEDSKAVIRGLYSVGFLGVRDPGTGKFVFCHDGRAPDREFIMGDKVLVHPCYWMALNSTKDHLEAEEAEDIYDEYDIEVSSETPGIRDQKINSLIHQLDAILLGQEGDTQFEAWCHKAIRICFAKGLRNVELKPNKLARSRRDVVGTNLGEQGVWKRIYSDYGTRQVTFEVKNYQGLQAADYQQIQSYLTGEYGRLAFVVTRDDSVDLFANRDVEWVREVYWQHQVLIIKLTGKYFAKLLYKLRNPQRHDDVNDALSKLLDTYTRLYLAGQTATQGSEDRRRLRRAAKEAKRQAKRVVAAPQ
jgi:hypothetical protein